MNISHSKQSDTSNKICRCRDPILWTAAAKVLYEDLAFPNQYPTKIQTIGFPTSPANANPLTAAANAVLLEFLAKLESFLGSKSTTLNYTALWTETKPSPTLPSLVGLLNTTYAVLVSKEQTRLLRDPFYANYGAIHDGRLPFVDPAPLVSSIIFSIRDCIAIPKKRD